MSVTRFNYAVPPPGPLVGEIKPWSELLEGTVAIQVDDGHDKGEVIMLAWYAPGGGKAHLYLRHRTGATPLDAWNRHRRARVIGALDERALVPRTEEQAIAAVWARWRMKNDPPGLRVLRAPGVQTHVEQRWFVEVIGAPGVGPVPEDGGLFLFDLDARRAAWKWYDARLELESEEGVLLEDHDGAPVPAAPVWPGCLAWPDSELRVVLAWMTDPRASLPEVLRMRRMLDGMLERVELDEEGREIAAPTLRSELDEQVDRAAATLVALERNFRKSGWEWDGRMEHQTALELVRRGAAVLQGGVLTLTEDGRRLGAAERERTRKEMHAVEAWLLRRGAVRTGDCDDLCGRWRVPGRTGAIHDNAAPAYTFVDEWRAAGSPSSERRPS